MADSTAHDKRDAHSNARETAERNVAMPASTQRGITIAALVATLAIVYLLQNVAKLDPVPTILIGLLVLVVLIFLATAVMTGRRRLKIKDDANATCKPILERYKKTGDVRRLLDDYERWAKGEHDPKLVLDFTQATVDALVDTGHDKQAHHQLRIMQEAIGNDPRGQQEFAKYKSQCESRLRAAKKNARKARR